MAYEVTKRINGRDYCYRVASERDPESGRSRRRWQYIGRLDESGHVIPPRTYAARTTAAGIVEATAQLLQSRDAAHVTVAVIAQQAGISTGTFYRHFRDRRSALDAAVDALVDRVIRELPPLTGRIGPPAAERERLFAWFAALERAVLEGRALRAVLKRPASAPVVPSPPALALRGRLAAYLQALHASGIARIADPEALAGALLRLHLSFVRDVVAGTATGSGWNEVFPVIERAVFPHDVAAA
jgi:AcrR family transcriptional regulator